MLRVPSRLLVAGHAVAALARPRTLALTLHSTPPWWRPCNCSCSSGLSRSRKESGSTNWHATQRAFSSSPRWQQQSQPLQSTPPRSSGMLEREKHVLTSVQRMLLSNSATESAFQRAMQLTQGDAAVELWQLLESAQADHSSICISRHDPNYDHVPSMQIAQEIRAAHFAASKLAPTQALYNLSIQNICAAARYCLPEHARFARGLFERMVQLGMNCTQLTYRRLFLAFSGMPPEKSGIRFVFERYKAALQHSKAEAAHAANTSSAATALPTLVDDISPYECMLYTLARFLPHRKKVPALMQEIRSLDAEMAKAGLVHNDRTLHSMLLAAMYCRSTSMAYAAWTKIRDQKYAVQLPVCYRLLQYYAGKQALWQLSPITFDQLRLSLYSIPFMDDVCSAIQESRDATSAQMRPQMLECRTEILARAYAACLAELPAHRAQVERLPAAADPPYLLIDLVATFQQAMQEEILLSKHVLLQVGCALHTLELTAVGSVESTFPSAQAAKLLDIPVLWTLWLQAMQLACHSLPPQLLVASFSSLCRSLSNSADVEALLSLLEVLLRSARQPTFVRQGLLSSPPQVMSPLAASAALLDISAWKDMVQRSLVLRELRSTAATFAVARGSDWKRKLQEAYDINRQVTPAVEADMLAEVQLDGDTQMQQLRAQSSSSGSSDLSAPVDIQPHSDVLGDSRLLFAQSVRSMLSSVLARELDTRPSRSSELSTLLSVLVESLWEGARTYGMSDALLRGELRFVLPNAVLHLQHPLAADVLISFQRTMLPLDPAASPAFLSDTADLLLALLDVLEERRTAMSDLTELLLQLDRLPAGVHDLLMSHPRFYRIIFRWLAREEGHSTHLLIYFQRALSMHEQEWGSGRSSPLLESRMELIAALDKCGDRQAMEEVWQALSRASSSDSSSMTDGGRSRALELEQSPQLELDLSMMSPQQQWQELITAVLGLRVAYRE